MINLKQYKCLILDMDNTIIASEAQHTAAFGAAMKSYANYTLTAQDERDYIGVTCLEYAKKIFAREGIDKDPAKLREEKWKYLYANFKLLPYPKAIDFINFVADKMPIAVASNSPSHFVYDTLKQLKILDKLKCVLTVDDVTKHKPDPEILLTIAKKCGFAPQECLVFEDSDTGLQAAANGGFPVLLMVNPGNLLPDVIPEEVPTVTWPQMLKQAHELWS